MSNPVRSELVKAYYRLDDIARLYDGCKLFYEMENEDTYVLKVITNTLEWFNNFDVTLLLNQMMESWKWKPIETRLSHIMRFLSNNYFSFGEIGVRIGKSVHAKMIRTPVDGDFEILNYLIKLHGTRGSPKDASLVFNSMKFKTIVTCN